MSKLEELKELLSLLNYGEVKSTAPASEYKNPMIGRRCVVRTYSAGVHIGTVAEVNPNNSMECRLTDALRLYNWKGSLSLSGVAANGISGGRLQKTGEVFLTNAIEYIPTTEKAEKSYVKFIEN